MSDSWEVLALRYAEKKERVRADNFILDAHYADSHPIDYFIWLLRNGKRTIVVDTGFDHEEAKLRARPIFKEPAEMLKPFGIDPAKVDTVIVTHLHYDHAGTLHHFPNAKFHIQASEMAYATGPCMCHPAINLPFTGEHIVQMVRYLFSGQVVFHDGDGEVAPGVTVHKIGGHSRGLQSARVKTEIGYLSLASDASHFYENYLAGKPFPIVIDLEDMLKGFRTIQDLASSPGLVVPGHDPLVKDMFPLFDSRMPEVWRLDQGPSGDIEALKSRLLASR